VRGRAAGRARPWRRESAQRHCATRRSGRVGRRATDAYGTAARQIPDSDRYRVSGIRQGTRKSTRPRVPWREVEAPRPRMLRRRGRRAGRVSSGELVWSSSGGVLCDRCMQEASRQERSVANASSTQGSTASARCFVFLAVPQMPGRVGTIAVKPKSSAAREVRAGDKMFSASGTIQEWVGRRHRS
jgi:hypothetical protein